MEDAVAFFVIQVTLLGDEGWQWDVSQDGLCSGQFARRNKLDYSTLKDVVPYYGLLLNEKKSQAIQTKSAIFCFVIWIVKDFFLLQAVVPAVMNKLRSWREFALQVAIYHTVCVVTGGYVFEQPKNYQYIHTYI